MPPAPKLAYEPRQSYYAREIVSLLTPTEIAQTFQVPPRLKKSIGSPGNLVP